MSREKMALAYIFCKKITPIQVIKKRYPRREIVISMQYSNRTTLGLSGCQDSEKRCCLPVKSDRQRIRSDGFEEINRFY